MIFFVRHGEVLNPDHVVYASLDGFDLSPLGEVQADRAGRLLSERDIVAIRSSPLRRALHTAHRIASATGTPVETEADLTEWALSDRWAGVGWDDLPDVFPGELEAYLADPTDLPFSPESLPDLAERVARVARRAAGDGGDIVLVSHQDPIHAAVRLLTGAGFEDYFRDRPEHAEPIGLVPGEPWSVA
jgi:probable phosphoglycerate mutase